MNAKDSIIRKHTRQIMVGSVPVGGDAPVSIQSMTNTDTRNIDATVAQIHALEAAGCEIVRCAVPDEEAAQALKQIKARTTIPLIADIHFLHTLAIKSMENGADAIRINPGNIGGEDKVKQVLAAAKAHGTAIRIGVNSGSLEKELVKSMGVCADAIVESALRHVRLFEDEGFGNFKVSLKASNVPMTLAAYRKFSEKHAAPLHIGVTEAGTVFTGTIKSAVGIGAMLADGIGDTLRVSLTGDPVDEVRVAWTILSSLDLRKRGPEIISCPTCGRTEIALVELAEKVEAECRTIKSHAVIAVMGCAVNGPGEAREADYGIAGGRGQGIIFRKGEIVKKVKEADLLEEFFKILKADGVE